jgi:hypothetical protein
MSGGTFWRCTGAMLVLALAPSPAAWAQGVFKCTVDGKTVYQAAPCEGQGKVVELSRGPSERDIQEAKKRAAADRSQASAADRRVLQRAEERTEQQARNTVLAANADCAGLNNRRASAYGRRNGAMRASRQDNIDRSTEVHQANADIQSIEALMSRAGCSMQ